MPINWSEYIESHLTGVSVDDSQHLIKIYMRTVDHQLSTITISGVDRFIVNEMRETNIVESISCWDERSSDADYIEPLVFLITGKKTGNGDDAFAAVIDKAKESIFTGGKVLLEILPVYGAQVIAMAASVSIEKQSG